MKRDNHACPCGERAVNVHHITYERVGREANADLISVCRECHERIHSSSRKVHNATKAVLKKARKAARKKAQRKAQGPTLPNSVKPSAPTPGPGSSSGDRRAKWKERQAQAKAEFGAPFRPEVGGGFPVKRRAKV